MVGSGLSGLLYGLATPPEFDKLILNMEYRDKSPLISNEAILDQKRFFEDHEKIMRTKSMNWKPENEWRIMLHDDKTKLPYTKMKLSENTISAVYIGCRLKSSEIANNIIGQTKKYHPRAKIYQAHENIRNLSLIFEEL